MSMASEACGNMHEILCICRLWIQEIAGDRNGFISKRCGKGQVQHVRLSSGIRRGCKMVSSARACHLIWGKTEQDEEMEVWSNSGGSWWNGQVAPVHVGKVCSLKRSSRRSISRKEIAHLDRILSDPCDLIAHLANSASSRSTSTIVGLWRSREVNVVT